MTSEGGDAAMKRLKSKTRFVLLALPLAGLLLAGCATDEPYPGAFGASVRHMIAAQTAYPGDRAAGLDGQKAETVLSTWRKDVAKPKVTEQKLIDIRFQ
jgi:type IV pilus biogenesis protein CpaD/CtpE